MRAKKSLGQHFLRSEKALRAIVETGDIGHGDTVVEIGPGRGALTEKLMEAGAKVIAVEKDDGLYEFLKQKYEKEIGNGTLELIHGDILEFNLSKLRALNYKLVANIPYNITGAVLKKFLKTDYQPKTMVLLLQKEVVERMVARDNKESILSISVKTYGTPKYVETVKAGSFAPAPKVDSAIIAIDDISKKFFTHFSEQDFFRIARTGFKARRKKLSSNLSAIFAKDEIRETFKKLDLDDNVRAEDVRIETWSKLVYLLI